jgi:L-malate glycosyltransferase
MSHSLGQGGGERQLALTALNMDRSRFEPHVGFAEGGFWVDRLKAAGIPFFVMGPRSLLSPSAIRESRRLREYIIKNGIQIVQTFDYTMNVLGIPAARSVPGVAVISNLRCHSSLIPAKFRWLSKTLFTASAGIVVNSEALRHHLTKDYSIPIKKIFTCYNGIDTNTFHPGIRPAIAGLEAASVVIGTICVLRPEKNLGLLLEAFELVSRHKSDLRLLITGSGPEESSIRALAARLNVSDRCVFRPFTPDVAGILPAIDVFVLPSINEGLSNALMEAMACGCCVVASRVGGNPELVSNEQTGLLFPSGDREALAEQLSRVVAEPDFRRRLGSAAVERMRKDFSLSRAIEQMQEIYDTILARRN